MSLSSRLRFHLCEVRLATGGELVQSHDDRDAIRTSPGDLPMIDIHLLWAPQPASRWARSVKVCAEREKPLVQGWLWDGVLRSLNGHRCRDGPRATPHRTFVTRQTRAEVLLAVLFFGVCDAIPWQTACACVWTRVSRAGQSASRPRIPLHWEDHQQTSS